MRKMLALILVLSMLLTMVSCRAIENPTTDCECSDCTCASGTTVTTAKKDEWRESEYDGYYFEKKDYEEKILNGQMRDGFLFAERFSEWGNLRCMIGIYTFVDGVKGINQYIYTYELADKEKRVNLDIHQGVGNFKIESDSQWHYLNQGVALILDHPSDDLRNCPYKEGFGVKEYSIYEEDEIVYVYVKGRLSNIIWMHEGTQYTLTNDYGYFDANFPQWRTWISLFLNKKSNDRAIEFFGLMLDGELPTIEEVFGPAQDEHGNPINNTPCEITWQKPTDPAQTA